MTFQHLLVEQTPLGLKATLNRPTVRNALNQALVGDLFALIQQVQAQENLRLLELCGADGHFCAGGDIADMQQAAQAYSKGHTDAFYLLNLRYGELLLALARLPCALLVSAQGSAMGGGLGLLACADIVIATEACRIAMPEVRLGLPPAQIAPFVAEKIGLANTRKLALCGERLNGAEAQALGLVDELANSATHFDELRHGVYQKLQAASPKALRASKQLLLESSRFAPANQSLIEKQLHRAAEQFSRAVTVGDGPEGTLAFLEKRAPHWATRAN